MYDLEKQASQIKPEELESGKFDCYLIEGSFEDATLAIAETGVDGMVTNTICF